VFAIADLLAAKPHHCTMLRSSHVVAASNFPDSYDDEYYDDCYYKRSSGATIQDAHQLHTRCI
jgi:hypothetical protein